MKLQDDKKLHVAPKVENKPRATERAKRSLDDAYVTAYCSNPKAGKKEALLKAGFIGVNPANEAHRLHKRLTPQIKARTSELIETLDTLAAAQLENILASDIDKVGYSNMTKVIQMGLDYNDRKPGDKLTIKVDEMSQDERRERIEYLQAKNKETRQTKH